MSNWLASLRPAGLGFKEDYYVKEAMKFAKTVYMQVRLFYGVGTGIEVRTPPSVRVDHYQQILDELNAKGFKASGPIKKDGTIVTLILWDNKPEIGEIA